MRMGVLPARYVAVLNVVEVMANHEIGYLSQNDANRRSALQRLDQLKKMQKLMKKKVVIEIVNGRKTIREYFIKRK